MPKKYDYIIVGAGSAGCVIAYRLGEDPDLSILVLEAGGRDLHPWLHMPLAFRNISRDRRFNWSYVSEPEPYANNRRIDLPRGKVIGGSSSINAMAYVRGHPRDYDQWRQMGLEGWSYGDVLPYFKRSETNWRGETEYHGGSGPLHVSRSDSPFELYEPLRDSAVAAGYAEIADYNGADHEGIGRSELTVGKGRRSSTATAYLRPALKRGNVTLEMHALSTRLLIERGRAIGVEFARDGQLHQVYAEREVILCGGTYNSPQLLMLSGIGPADELRAVGVTPTHDLPGVGQNLSDHPFVRLEYGVSKPITFVNQIRFDRAAFSTLRWALFRSGPFTTAGTTARIFARTRDEFERPDIMFTFSPVQWGVNPWFPMFTKPPIHRLTSGVQVLHQDSRGHMALRSADPTDKPRIWINLFKEKSDMDTMIRGIRAAREIYVREPLASLVSRETDPGAECQSDADLDAFVRRSCTTAQHPVGTCSMGIDDRAVVDAQLRVRGIADLRVADASVMPTIPGGNINAAAIMIGEKASDLIRGHKALASDY